MSDDNLVRACVIPAPHDEPEVRRYSSPSMEPGSVLVRVIVSEVCGTDVHLWHGKLSGVPYPLIPGHISVGEVLNCGGDVHTVTGELVKAGDIITFLDVFGTCNACWYCLVAKASTRCPHRKVYGITVGADEYPGLSGGWAEQIYLRPGTHIIPLASNLSPEDWIGGGCGLPTAMHAVERASIKLGDRVLIQGSGPVGLSCAALALLSGAAWVGLIGAPDIRLKAAEKFGVDWTVNVEQTTLHDRHRSVLDITRGKGADITIEASGNPLAVSEALNLTRDAGRVVIVGQYTDNGDISINPHLQINKKHLEILGCWGSDFSHVYNAMECMSRFNNRIHWEDLITKAYRLEDAGEALRDVESKRVVKAIITP